MVPFVPPKFGQKSFNCPHCNAYARQIWYDLYTQRGDGIMDNFEHLRLARCSHCSENTLWHFEKLIYPGCAGMQPPNADLKEDIKVDYLEAAGIASKSPRGAAALLRLAIQKLCKQLGEKGENPNEDISNLVKKGLPAKVQQALDIVRVVGNNAVHPGQIDLKDDTETALKLFDLVNMIAQVMITQPKEVEALYQNLLPPSAREAIERRDDAAKK